MQLSPLQLATSWAFRRSQKLGIEYLFTGGLQFYLPGIDSSVRMLLIGALGPIVPLKSRAMTNPIEPQPIEIERTRTTFDSHWAVC